MLPLLLQTGAYLCAVLDDPQSSFPTPIIVLCVQAPIWSMNMLVVMKSKAGGGSCCQDESVVEVLISTEDRALGLPLNLLGTAGGIF